MRFVHVISRLKQALEACQTRLYDLDDMAIEILNSTEPYTAADAAMVGLIEACEGMESKESRRLKSRIIGYEHRREFGG